MCCCQRQRTWPRGGTRLRPSTVAGLPSIDNRIIGLALLTVLCCLVDPTCGQESIPRAEELSVRSREVDMRVQFELSEGQPPGTVVGNIPMKPNFSYRFNERPPEFYLNGTTGVITTAVELDRESLPSERFDLVVLSSQPTYPIEVRIVVLDINDNAPSFPEPSIEVSFSESANIGTRVILDTATDGDVGINDVTTDYKIISGNEDSKFLLVVTTNPSGETPYLHLETTGRLDREVKSFYQLNISAQDGGFPPKYGYLQVNISVLDVNDNPPIFDHSDYSVSLNESVPPGTSVIQVRATDNDLGDNAKIAYFLSETETQFSVDSQTGTIFTTDFLKCQQKCPTLDKCPKSCVFTVFARDHGSPRQDGRAYVTVNLLDANDHDPIIKFRFFPSTASYATVDENAQNGSVVAAVSVIDHDEGPNGDKWVEIQGGNELNQFRLDPSSGFDIVRVNGILDREQIGKYNLTLVATDKGTPPRSSTAFLIIHVNDVNDHEPVFEKNDYSAVLSELVPIGSYVVGITATDEDTGVNSDIYYAIVSGNDKRWFDIDIQTGLVTTSQILNREDQDYVELKISARDGGPNPRWAYTYLRIQILDENDEIPTFPETNINVSLSENSPAHSLVAVVSAVDNDLGTNGSVTYHLHPSTERMYPNHFSLASSYGRITTNGQLDREEESTYVVKVIAKDQGQPSLSSTVTIHIRVMDVNDNKPLFYPEVYFRSLKPTDPVGTVVAELTATDADVGENAELRFTISSGADGKFDIDEQSGIIKNKVQLTKPKFEIVVKVHNKGDMEGADQAVVMVFVSSRDASEWQFEQGLGYSFVVEEDVHGQEPMTGREVGRVSMRRTARAQGVKYVIANGDHRGWFHIDEVSGIITTAREIDREVQSKCTLEVVGHGASSFVTTIVNVSITDLNDYYPTFASPVARVEVMEDWPVGHEVYLVKANDLDYGPNGKVEYHLSNRGDNTFVIDKVSGMIYLNRPVRYEAGTQFDVEVMARDIGVRSLTSRMQVLVTVKDVNDRTPVFDHLSYETSLPESAHVNERFFMLRASDADAGWNGQVSYEITQGNEEKRFGIFPDGFLYVKRPLNRETRDYYSLKVVAKDNGTESRSSEVQMIVHIIDENDNSPHFDNKTFTFYIAENEPPDTYVGRLSAEDADKGRNAELTYSITTNQNDFIVNPKSGFIRTLRYFDREQLIDVSGHGHIMMEAIVLDGGTPRLRDEAKVIVYITDVNDNPPQFVRTPYHTAVLEGAALSTQIIRVAAVDADDGLNGNVLYTISDGNSDNCFQIDEFSGQITLASSLDRERQALYQLTVVARDAGEDVSFSATSTVLIDILDENDNAPQFEVVQKHINISEDTVVGSRIFTFSAADADLGINSEVTFSVAAGNIKETFRMDGPSGILYLARPLDYEEKNVYVLNVSASDGGAPRLTSTLQFIVRVLDVNDNPPRFSSTAVVRQIEESIPVNTAVVTLSAQDRDLGRNGKLLFNISDQDPPGKHFAIHPETGLIYTLLPIDREYSDTFRLTVVATDQAVPISSRLKAEKTVTIIVEDINDNAPTFVSMDAGVLPADSSRGYVVMTLSAIDPDANNNGMVTYELEGEDAGFFAVDRTTGDLYLTRPVERPAVSYSLTVKATDQAVISVRKSSRNKVTVIGTSKARDGPVFAASEYSGSVLENELAGTSVLSVRAQYPGGQSEKQIEYFLTAVYSNDGLQNRVFAINRYSGVISTTTALDREGTAQVYEMDVYAIDSSASTPKTSKTKVTITVMDSNDSPPVFKSDFYKVSLSENALPGHTVVIVSATDPDIEGSLSYVLADDREESKFQLDPRSGALLLGQPLDRETQAVHKVVIKADDGVQSSETTVIIELIDSNDNSPVFDHPVYSFDIPEGTQRGAQAGIVSATDADTGVNGQISYTVLSDWGNDVFSLNPQTGVFTLTSHLDYEQMQHYIFVVQAQDSGQPSLSSTVTVYFNVLDLNDNAPLFDPMSYSDEVFENITIGTSILQVTATDQDSGDNGRIIYSIIDGNKNDQFSIDANGTVFTSKMLDRETQSFYTLTVSATDQALPVEKRLSTTVQVTVILKDVNDMSPEFVTPNQTSVLENVPINTVVMAIKANDKDEGHNSYIEYSLSLNPENKFSLGPIDGLLRVSGSLDREVKSKYEISVIAKDRGYPSQSAMAHITVNILDENDNSPNFDPKQYSATVLENVSVGLSILQVSASDQDEAANSQVQYSIIAGDPNHDFVIGQDTGIIRVSKNLDYERKNRYMLTVQAEDSGDDVRYDTATVAIAVMDVNDNPPTFLDSPYIVHVMENADLLPVTLMTITAYDTDLMSNNQLHYLMKEGDKNLFQINSSTGELKVWKSLDREQQAEYVLTVVAMDSGTPRQTGTGTVTIMVSDANDNEPHFTKSEYIASIMENLPPNSPIITVTASDADVGRNSLLKYTLVGDHEDKFTVDIFTGTILTRAVLDREEQSHYNMILIAQDSGLIMEHSASTNITVYVDDENDSKPQFPESSYIVYIPDSASGGHFVFGAHAEDWDVGLNSKLVYHLSGTDADKFQINQDTGVVKLVQKLTNRSDGYHLEIHATDSGLVPLSSTTVVKVHLQPAHLFPRFHPGIHNFKLSESAENLVVTRVSASSTKTGGVSGRVTYRIAGGNMGNVFTVSQTGEVQLTGGLDRETVSLYELWVEAKEEGSPSLASVLKLEVQVMDVNDNAPQFDREVYNATVREELEPPLFVMHVQATDADFEENGKVIYQLSSQHSEVPFSLDPKTGKIFTTAVLDREETEFYHLVIEAVDQGVPQKTSTATVFITVLDKNDNPPRFTRLFSANVTENAPIGTFVIQVTSSDRDVNMNANATYSFTENPSGKFHIDPLSGNVTVAGWIDREVKDEYLLKVAAVDGSWQAETPLTVLVQDVNDNAPEFSEPMYSFNIPELLQSVSFVGQVSAVDRDKQGPDSMISYSLKRPSDLFRIDPASGEILSKQVLYYKRTVKGPSPENQHMIQVVATDHGNPPLSAEITVTITVIDTNNNAPVFVKSYYFSPVPENAHIGLSVLQVEANDEKDVGINAEIEYLKTGGNGSDFFNVHKTTGWITVKQSLLIHRDQQYSLKIQAVDKGVPPKSTEVAIDLVVTTENQYKPTFTALSYQVVIPENEPLYSEIVTVTATDKDYGLNGAIVYSIISGGVGGHFQIGQSTGAITIVKPLDFEKTKMYQLNISAADRGFKSKNTSALLTVVVTDVNDNPPIFNSSVFDAYVTENEPQGTYITQLIAVDADSSRNNVIQYSIVEGYDKSLFAINSSNGILTSKVIFDYEQKTEYSIKVIASNPDPTQFSSTIVNVHIIGKNEFFPHFIQPIFQFTVSESAGIGTLVGTLNVVDEDSGPDGEVFFLLVGSSNNRGFQIHPKTGNIKVIRKLDRESQSRVVLTVMAKNSGSIRGNDTDEAQVVISIQDGNDPPVFSKPVYEAHISEAAPLDASVVTVSAVDKDVHPNNNQFSYSILDGNIERAFIIDPQSGIIQTAASLDRETVSAYNLTVTATDSGNPPQSGTALVKVFVDDVNDNGPVFATPDVVGYVTENEPAFTSVMVLSVTDPDLPPNGAPFRFFLVGGDHGDFFEVDTHTGLVKTIKGIDREVTPRLKFLVEIQDNGTPQMKSRHLVNVVVLDKNDSPSIPRSLTVFVWVFKNFFPGGKIADVSPLDPDTTGQYQCTLLDGDNSVFSILTKCNLHAAKLHNPQNYTITVAGNDGRHPNVTSAIKIKFLSFNNQTLENSLTLRIWNHSADDFLTLQFDQFQKILHSMFKPLESVTIYSLTNVNSHTEITLAVKRSQHSFYSQQDVLNVLQEKLTLLQEVTDNKEITVGYNPCDSSPCQNNGKCTSYLDMQDSLSVVESPALVYTSLRVIRHYSCQCPQGFSGLDCQYQQDPCLPNPCLSGGTCHHDGIMFKCICPPQYQGEWCEALRKDSCASAPCKNGGTCEEAPIGSFFCLCRPGFRGIVCELTTDSCRPNKCLNGATCISENFGIAGYQCLCAPSFFGRHCEKSSYGFHSYSYMAFTALHPSTNDISVVFSTIKQNALLIYNYGTHSGGRSDFLSLEIIKGNPYLSFGGARTAVASITASVSVADGKWHRITIIRNGKVASLSVVSCTENGETCDECVIGNATCSVSTTGHTGTLNFNNNFLYVGGVPSVEPLLERPGQVSTDDFVGCLRSISLNGRPLDLSSPVRSMHTTATCGRKQAPCSTTSPCGEGATCVDEWFTASCSCPSGVVAPSCADAERPLTIEHGASIDLLPQEKHQRMQLLNERWKESSQKVFSIMFRTTSQNGILLRTTSQDEYTVLMLKKGKLVYQSKVKNSDPAIHNLEVPVVADGHWHKISLSLQLGKQASLNISLDDQWQDVVPKQEFHDFLDAYISSLTIGGHWNQIQDAEDASEDFHGCIKMITVNGEAQVMNSTLGFFKIIPHGHISSECSIEASGIDTAATDPLSIGVILVIVFFVILIVVILVSFLVFRRRKQRRDKGPGHLKQNGNAFLTNPNNDGHRSHKCSGYTETSPPEEVLRSHIPQDLVPKKLKERDPAECPQRPDIIEREIHNKPSSALRLDEQSIQDNPKTTLGVQNSADSEAPEHYDLENASSIAPSDIDIVYHYKGFRDGNVHKYKPNPQVSSYHKHSHRHSPNQFQTNPVRESPRNVLHQAQNPLPQRESPSSIKMQNTPLARLSPSSELSQQTPRILTLQDISGKPLQKALLATSQGVGSKQFQDPLTNSDRSLNSPVSNLSHSTSSMHSGPQSVSKKKRNTGMTLGLTSEEIERLNARPRNLSLVSTLDAVSSSSDENPEKHKLAELLETNTELLEAQDSSTDESGNDSFTCSEFEYDNNYDKVHREFGPRNMIFSKLAEEDNENDEDYNKNYDGFDSFQGSFSTLVASDDESSNPPSYKPANGSMLGWDCLLNWGPNFENLVGVFKDIEQLPDTLTGAAGHSQDEDYV